MIYYICNMCEWEGSEDEVEHTFANPAGQCPYCHSDSIEELEEETDEEL